MGIAVPQYRIAQVYKISPQQGMIMHTFFVSWQNDPVQFCATMSHGSQHLNTNRCDKSKEFTSYANWDDMVAGIEKLTTVYGYTFCQELPTKAELWKVIQSKRSQRDESFQFIPKTA